MEVLLMVVETGGLLSLVRVEIPAVMLRVVPVVLGVAGALVHQ